MGRQGRDDWAKMDSFRLQVSRFQVSGILENWTRFKIAIEILVPVAAGAPFDVIGEPNGMGGGFPGLGFPGILESWNRRW